MSLAAASPAVAQDLVVPADSGRAGAPDFTPRLDAVKSDSVWMRNGDVIQGEIKGLQRGLLSLKTDAASTISMKWPRIITISTKKWFEIHLDDKRRYYGTMRSAGPYRVAIQGVTDTVEVPTLAIVELTQIKTNVWSRLDGSLDLGLDFTQQNTKVDLNLNTQVRYNVAANRMRLDFNGTFSRQDSVSDIRRRNLLLQYAREFSTMWLWTIQATGSENSQLGLDFAWSAGTGPGRFIILSNRINLATYVVLSYRREQYVDVDARNTIPLAVVADFQFFNWAGMSTDMSSNLSISPILNDGGRWQIKWTAGLKRELLNSLYLTIQVNEYFDSQPPGDQNKNDVSLTTSLGWTF